MGFFTASMSSLIELCYESGLYSRKHVYLMWRHLDWMRVKLSQKVTSRRHRDNGYRSRIRRLKRQRELRGRMFIDAMVQVASTMVNQEETP